MIVFIDGFDHYKTEDIYKKWTGGFAVAEGQTSSGVSSSWAVGGYGQGLRVTNNQSIYKNLNKNISGGVIGFYYKTNVAPVNSGKVIHFSDGSSEQCSLRTNNSANLLFCRGDTTLQTSINTLSINTWHHIELKFLVHNTNGMFELRVNGSSSGWLSSGSTLFDTASTANNYFSRIGMSHPNTSPYPSGIYDDLYLFDNNAPNNDFVGPQKVFTLYPMAKGTYDEWTPNWVENFGNVNDINLDSDYSFNYTSTGSAIDTFKFQDVVSGSITGIQVDIAAKQDAGTQHSIDTITLFSGSSFSSGSTLNTPVENYVIKTTCFDADPDGNVWTPENLNNTEFGYKLVT